MVENYTERIQEKARLIKQFLNEVSSIVPETLSTYMQNFEKRAACERYAEKIIEAVEDVAFLVMRLKKLSFPDDEEEIFPTLVHAGIIPELLAVRLRAAKGMRNFIAHEYGKVDNKIVFCAVSGELENDVHKFLKAVAEVKKEVEQ
jgi:uncharacterized protein YutE (UPF0331/DUF86 family)